MLTTVRYKMPWHKFDVIAIGSYNSLNEMVKISIKICNKPLQRGEPFEFDFFEAGYKGVYTGEELKERLKSTISAYFNHRDEDLEEF